MSAFSLGINEKKHLNPGVYNQDKGVKVEALEDPKRMVLFLSDWAHTKPQLVKTVLMRLPAEEYFNHKWKEFPHF